MKHDPSIDPQGEDELQQLFDATAEVPSEAQLARLLTHAETAPTRVRGGARSGRFWIPLAAAAAIALAVGGAMWLSGSGHGGSTATATVRASATTADGSAVPHAVAPAPTAVASSDPIDDVEDAFYPDDPLAALDTAGDDSGEWMSELDLLHDPADTDEAAYWDAMEQLLEDDG